MKHVLGDPLGAQTSGLPSVCDWVIAWAGLEDDDCDHSQVAEPPLCVFSCRHV